MSLDIYESSAPAHVNAAERPTTISETIGMFVETASPVQISLIAFAFFAAAFVAIYRIYRRKHH